MHKGSNRDPLSLEKAAREEWDVVIVGGATAGSSAARTAASGGARTLIVDKEALKLIGKKICGDAVSHRHFERTGIDPPIGEDLSTEYEGVRIFSPNLKTAYLVSGRGYSVNRHEFGQRLLREAIIAGAELLPATQVIRPLQSGGVIEGVVAKSQRGEVKPIRAKIVIDASGWRSVVRKEVAQHLGIDESFSDGDMAFCYREIRRLGKPQGERDFANIYLDLDIAPGGYWWLFPKDDGRKVNIGMGVLMSSRKNPRKLFEKHLAPLPILEGSEIIDAGAGSIPTRRPLDTLVGDGVIFVGDAASTANPLHGGGIGQSMYSGALAGEVAAEAVSEGDTSLNRLWAVNLAFMRGYGRQNAVLDVFRRFLQRLNNGDINFGMARGLVSQEDLQQRDVGRSIELSLMAKVGRALGGLEKPSLLWKLSYVGRVMRRVRGLYEEYPEQPEGIEGWAKEVDETFREFERSLM